MDLRELDHLDDRLHLEEQTCTMWGRSVPDVGSWQRRWRTGAADGRGPAYARAAAGRAGGRWGWVTGQSWGG